MKLILIFLSACFAQNNFDWNLSEISLNLNYKGGVTALVTDLLGDYGYPETFIGMFNDTTDESIIGAFAAFTDNTRNSLLSETTADNGLFTFYAGLINSMTLTTTYTRQELEANVHTGFLDTQIPVDADIAAIMDAIVTNFYDPAFAAAVANAAEPTPANVLTFTANVNSALRSISKDFGLGISTASAIENVIDVLNPILYQSLSIWENFGEQTIAFNAMVQAFTDYTDFVIFGSIGDMCDQKVGAFGMIHQMAVRTHETFELLEAFKNIDLLTTDMSSLMFFGETGHKLIDWYWYADTYIFQYTDPLAEMGGVVERNLNLLALILDPSTFPFIYELVKAPICGITV